MSLKSLKHHSSLIPLFVIMGAGMAFVAAFCLRSVTKASDISWKKEEAPYNAYQYKQYKFLNPSGIDFKKEGEKIPKYKD